MLEVFKMCSKVLVECLTLWIFMLFFIANAQFLLPKVVEGTPTSIDRYPIMAQLLLDSWGTQQFVQHCAGVILTSRHVLSTAHCFQHNVNTGRNYALPKYWKVRVGSTYRTRGGVIHNIKAIIVHSGFDKYFFTNDVAVVVVTKPFTFNSKVRQSSIIKQNVELKPNSVCTLIGWGVVEINEPQPEQLQQANMFTIDQNICRTRYSAIGAAIADSMLCAGLIDLGGFDGCFGDSGGPLIYKGLVVGLVSFGYSCGHRYYPGVYTKVSHFTDWIVKTSSTYK